jgi:signal transduction histidine kinase
LNICKQIIDKLEGTINYRSSLAGETIFFFRVPCREVEGEELVEEESREYEEQG